MEIKRTLFYDEFCKMKGWPLVSNPENDAAQRAEWERYNESIRQESRLWVSQPSDGRITRTWREDRAVELRRRGYNRFWRVIWPPEPLRIVRFGAG